MSVLNPFLRSIRGKLLISFSVLVASIAIFIYGFFPERLERQSTLLVRARANTVRDIAAYTIGPGLIFDDTVAMREVLTPFVKDQDIAYFVVRDSVSRIKLVYGDVAPEDRSSDANYYVTSGPIYHKSRRIGTVTVGMSLARLKQDMAEAERLSGMVSLFIFFIGFIIAWLISTLVTQPLTAVSQTVRQIASGDLSLRAAEDSDIEIAQFARAFNRMVDNLVGAQDQLATANQSLEARVELRTQALRQAISDQRLAQEKLAQSEAEARSTSENLQSLIDLAPLAIVVVDLEWTIIRWNKAAESLFGWTAQKVMGKPVPFVPDEDMDSFRSTRTLAAFDRATSPREVTRMRSDGTRVSVLESARTLRDRQQSPFGYIIVLTDLTDRKSLEEELRHAQKMEAVGRLAGGIAHDFNNILMVIGAYAQMMLSTDRSDEDRKDIEQIASATARAASLTRQLLTFSRKQVVQLQPLDLNEIVQEVDPLVRRLLFANIYFSTTLDDQGCMIVADHGQMHQVLMNLLINAADAMPQGGELLVATNVVYLNRAQSEEMNLPVGQYVMLSVSDTGVGMDAATLSKIFEPFFTTKEPGRGTGLGLATAYAVVTQLGGHIVVQSEPNRGTIIRIYLPRTSVEQVAGPRTTPPRSLPAGGREGTILLVEDDETVRSSVQRMLLRLGYSVLAAENGEVALTVAQENRGKFDIVLTDMMMPVMNGRAFVDALMQEQPTLRVIYMSGYTAGALDGETQTNPNHFFLQKPFTIDELASVLLDARRRTRQTPVGT
jgi:PAS domain S-box-containing protein